MLDDVDRLAAMDEDVAGVAKDIGTIKTEFGILQRDFAAIVDSINAYWLTPPQPSRRSARGCKR
jgi:hypothetical protein